MIRQQTGFAAGALSVFQPLAAGGDARLRRDHRMRQPPVSGHGHSLAPGGTASYSTHQPERCARDAQTAAVGAAARRGHRGAPAKCHKVDRWPDLLAPTGDHQIQAARRAPETAQVHESTALLTGGAVKFGRLVQRGGKRRHDKPAVRCEPTLLSMLWRWRFSSDSCRHERRSTSFDDKTSP